MTKPASDRMIICITNKQTFEFPLCFEVRVQVDLGGHQVIWTMDVLLGMRVPIHLYSGQQLILIAYSQELLVASLRTDRHFLSSYKEKR